MPKFDPEHYLSAEAYGEAAGVFHAISGIILFEFAREGQGKRDVIIRNFIARTDVMVRSVLRLWELKDYQDCWILHRCLLDRLFHLYHLNRHDQFEEFEAWSFMEQFNAMKRVRSDPEFSGARKSRLFELAPEQKKRALALAKKLPYWRRPKAEDVARDMDMRFLYRIGYDYASTHIHPMANDGHQDFFIITKLEPAPEFPDQRSVLSNTLLVGTMIMQEGLNASTLSWRTLVYDFLDDLRGLLDTGKGDYRISFVKVSRLVERGERLCRKRAGGS